MDIKIKGNAAWKGIIEIKNEIITLNAYSKIQAHDNERIYEELLLDYINNVGFDIELTRRLLKWNLENQSQS